MNPTNPINPINPTNPRGFTLIEILIAVFILAIVLSTIFTSYTGTFRIMEDTESQADIYGMARIALKRMQEDLESVYILKGTGSGESEEDIFHPSPFVGKDGEIKGTSADTLRFLSRAHLVLDEGEDDSGVAEIIYFVRENDEGDALVLYRSDTPQFGNAPEEGTGGMILCDALFSVNFIYYDSYGETYESWDSAGRNPEHRLPSRVSIFLEFVDRSNQETPLKFMTGVALPIVRDKYGKFS